MNPYPDDTKPPSTSRVQKRKSELPPMCPIHAAMCIPSKAKLQTKEDSDLQLQRHQTSSHHPLDDVVKGKNWLQSIAKESIYGENTVKPTEINERERRILLRDTERKKRAPVPEPGSCGQLSAAGANIILQRENDIESIRPAMEEKGYFNSGLRNESETDKTREGYFLFKGRLSDQQKVLSFAGPSTISNEAYNPESFARFRKEEIDLELVEKREKQQFLVKSELDKQIEEKRRRKFLELKKKEEDQKEEQELAIIYKQEESSKAFNKLEDNRSITRISRQPIKDNDLLVQRYNSSHIKKPIEDNSSNIMNKSNLKVVSKRILDDYKKEIESLANERQLDREKALFYREQIIIERERQLQLMLEQVAANKHPKFNQPAVRPERLETKETCEESQESSTLRLPTRDSNNLIDSMKRAEIFEQSLVSDTKFVVISPNAMDITWRPSKEIAEQSVQTGEYDKGQTSRICSKTAPKNEAIEEESIIYNVIVS